MRRLRALGASLLSEPTAVEVCADFEPYRLVQARHLAMLGRGDLADRVGVPAWQVLHWESAISVPKPYQLERIAEVTGQIVAFFKRGRPMAIIDSSRLFVCTVDR